MNTLLILLLKNQAVTMMMKDTKKDQDIENIIEVIMVVETDNININKKVRRI